MLLAYPQTLNSGLFLYFWPMFALGIVLFQLIKHDWTSDVLGQIFPSVSLGFATVCALILWFGQPIGRVLEAAKHGGLRWLIKAAAFLGVISYSVYLLHGKLFELPAMLVRQLLPLPHPLNAFLTVLGTLALCAVFYLYCERPFLSKKLQKLNENAQGN